MFDVGTISLVLLISMFVLLAIGMPLGFASAFLAVMTLVMKFGPDLLFSNFGRGPLAVLGQAVYRQMTNYVLIFIAECLAQPHAWRYCNHNVNHGCHYGRDVGHHWGRSRSVGIDCTAADVAVGL